jgi:hypothetical protein
MLTKNEMVICKNQGLLSDNYLFSSLKVKHLGTNLSSMMKKAIEERKSELAQMGCKHL